MSQRWSDLLFAHWPVRPETVRDLIPSRLDLDRFDGSAWLTITPFRMTNVRPRGMPPVPGLSAFPETNFRTYVTAGGKAGVFFFSLDAGNRIAVAAAKRFFHLPYFYARMRVETVARRTGYESRRIGGGPPAEFIAHADSEAGEFHAFPGSLDHFLAERYCLYAADGDRILRSEIHHAPWPLLQAHAEIRRNTLPASLGLTLDARPALTRFARRLDVRVWLPGRAD